MTGPVYANSYNTSDVKYKSVYVDERETNIEDSVISDGYREMEKVKNNTHKNNAKKV